MIAAGAMKRLIAHGIVSVLSLPRVAIVTRTNIAAGSPAQAIIETAPMCPNLVHPGARRTADDANAIDRAPAPSMSVSGAGHAGAWRPQSVTTSQSAVDATEISAHATKSA